MIDGVFPHARVLRVRRLRGGIGARVHAVHLQLADGTRTKVVLRRARESDDFEDAERMTRHFKTLKVLEEAGVPAPVPLLLDADAAYFDSPSLLMTYVGEPLANPRNVDSWLAQLANAHAQVHRITPERFDLSHLDSFTTEDLHERIKREPREEIANDPLGQEVARVLKASFPKLSRTNHVLIHRDFWPGNTVWRRGRLTGIVDWPNAQVGDARIDVAQCRIDLAMMHGVELADGFLRAYEASALESLRDVWFFDLYRAIRALPELLYFEQGYVDLGMTELTGHVLEARLRAFIQRGLKQAALAD